MDLERERGEQNWRKYSSEGYWYNRECYRRGYRRTGRNHTEKVGVELMTHSVCLFYFTISHAQPSGSLDYKDKSHSQCQRFAIHWLFQSFPDHQVSTYQVKYRYRQGHLFKNDLGKEGQLIALWLLSSPGVAYTKETIQTEAVSHSYQVRAKNKGVGLSNCWSSALNCFPFVPRAACLID